MDEVGVFVSALVGVLEGVIVDVIVGDNEGALVLVGDPLATLVLDAVGLTVVVVLG